MHSASDFRQSPIFRASFHTIVTSRASYYAPPDTGVPNLILVASEQLPSIEGAVEILMDVPFLRGPCRGGALLRPLFRRDRHPRAEQRPVPTERTQRLPFQGPIPPIRGKCPEGTKGVGMLSAQLTEGLLLQICNCSMPPAAPSFPSCRKRRGRKGTLGYVWCILPLNLGGNLSFRRRSTR